MKGRQMKPILTEDRLTALASAHAANPAIVRGIVMEHLDRGGRIPDQLLRIVDPTMERIWEAVGL